VNAPDAERSTKYVPSSIDDMSVLTSSVLWCLSSFFDDDVSSTELEVPIDGTPMSSPKILPVTLYLVANVYITFSLSYNRYLML